MDLCPKKSELPVDTIIAIYTRHHGLIESKNLRLKNTTTKKDADAKTF